MAEYVLAQKKIQLLFGVLKTKKSVWSNSHKNHMLHDQHKYR